MSDDGLDGGAAAQFALDDTEDAALLAGDEDAAEILRVVPAVSLIDINPLDRVAREYLAAYDDVALCVTVVELSGSELACGTNRPPGARQLLVTI